jgi:peptide-methionine (S)-S-oxide reductase
MTIGAAAGLVGLALMAKSWAGRTQMSNADSNPSAHAASNPSSAAPGKLEKATFGTGCFWCTEAVFDELKGVESVVSGYSGGALPDPTYEQVCGGLTGHAEVVQITFDPAVISFADLLEAFWQTHDPTTLNRQGNDVGTQYRSAIFYHSDEQRQEAEHYKQKLNASGAFRGPIVTEIKPYKNFYPAEKYHQDYFAQNPYQSYCAAIIRPKVEKFKKVFADKLKDAPEKAGTAKP